MVVNQKKMRPKRNSDEQRSLTQKTNCCLIYFQICRTKRQRSSPYNFYFSCFLYGFIGGKASQNTSFDSQKSQRSPWNLLCSSSSSSPQSFEIFLHTSMLHTIATSQQQFMYKYASRDDAIFSFQIH